ncbi:MAG: TIGR00180 family glycosyltransferase [Maritimibacter sp.]|nr:TIGR00180 family glycosyltransferase [Maritimibacter sp.]
MPKLLIPTRNRPFALGQVLDYLERFYPGTEVIVADGSADEYKAAVAETCGGRGGAAVDLRSYPYELPLFERILDVLRSEDGEYFVMGADDDFPMMEVMDEGEAFLEEHPDHCLAMGSYVSLFLQAPDSINAQLRIARTLAQENPLQRMRSATEMVMQTTYATARRDLLIERYDRARHVFLTGFFDFATALQDSIRGKIHAFPKIGFISTRNYNHSYLRQEDNLIHLRRSDDLLWLIHRTRDDLVAATGMDEDRATVQCGRLFNLAICNNSGRRFDRVDGFHEGPVFKHPAVQRQIEDFNDLFKDGTAVREVYRERLSFIGEALRANAMSEDNRGEKDRHETLEQQQAASR